MYSTSSLLMYLHLYTLLFICLFCIFITLCHSTCYYITAIICILYHCIIPFLYLLITSIHTQLLYYLSYIPYLFPIIFTTVQGLHLQCPVKRCTAAPISSCKCITMCFLYSYYNPKHLHFPCMLGIYTILLNEMLSYDALPLISCIFHMTNTYLCLGISQNTHYLTLVLIPIDKMEMGIST